MDTNPKQQVIDRLKQANNVLVTVSKNPSVDQLAACIGISLALNKLGKHATAVYSGETPSTIEFLKPEETIEKNTDSLRDFIISLDKAKADKLRYKVEDQVVRIFITPYKTSITDQDLDFSQGDFNVDVVLAIGVHAQEDLDQAITAHGRILHDATVVTANTTNGGELGAINWVEPKASSLAEMAVGIAIGLGKDLLDEQISTALLTGIVAETERFRNEKTSADTMNVSALLMTAGANQQLVATKLQETPEISELDTPSPDVENTNVTATDQQQSATGGTLQIEHPADEVVPVQTSQLPVLETEVDKVDQPDPLAPPPVDEIPEPTIEYDDPAATQPKVAVNADSYKNQRHVLPAENGASPAFTSAVFPNSDDVTPPVSSVDLPPVAPNTAESHEEAYKHETLQDIEKQVHSPHIEAERMEETAVPQQIETAVQAPEELNLAELQRPEGIDAPEEGKPDLDAARNAVAEAMAASVATQPPTPIAALNAQQFGGPLQNTQSESLPQPQPEEAMTMPVPATFPTPEAAESSTDEPKAPPVPPPVMPPPFSS
jgi:hypothetical protein